MLRGIIFHTEDTEVTEKGFLPRNTRRAQIELGCGSIHPGLLPALLFGKEKGFVAPLNGGYSPLLHGKRGG
jgi:hypothetical protein